MRRFPLKVEQATTNVSPRQATHDPQASSTDGLTSFEGYWSGTKDSTYNTFRDNDKLRRTTRTRACAQGVACICLAVRWPVPAAAVAPASCHGVIGLPYATHGDCVTFRAREHG
jgi:hypothetical protein